MERGEETVRVWTGLNLVQAMFLEQELQENGIEYFQSKDTGLFLAAGRMEISFWVGKKDEARARTVLRQAEEEMSAALDADAPETDFETTTDQPK